MVEICAGGKLALKDIPKTVPKVATGKAMQRKWYVGANWCF